MTGFTPGSPGTEMPYSTSVPMMRRTLSDDPGRDRPDVPGPDPPPVARAARGRRAAQTVYRRVARHRPRGDRPDDQGGRLRGPVLGARPVVAGLPGPHLGADHRRADRPADRPRVDPGRRGEG